MTRNERLIRVLAFLMSLLVIWWSVSVHGLSILALCWIVFGWGLIALAIIDFRTMLLPDALTLPLMWMGIVLQLFPQTRTIGLEASVWGAIAGYVPLWLLAQFYHLVRHREGLGLGDLKLLAAMGAWSGAIILPIVIFMAATLALLAIISTRILRRASMGGEFPFGPWIIFAYIICNIFGFKIMSLQYS